MIYQLIPMIQQGASIQNILLVVLAYTLAVLIALILHEWAHAFVAYKLGDPTAKNLGRMSLDPSKHLDPIGAICFLLLGIGWARPVLINSANLKHFRRDDVLISIAGPLTNLILAFLFYGLYFFGTAFQFLNGPMLYVVSVLMSMNLTLAIFNIFPIPPLDGYHVLSSLFIRKSYRVVQFFQKYGFIILLVLIASGLMSTIINWIGGGLQWLFFSFYQLFL